MKERSGGTGRAFIFSGIGGVSAVLVNQIGLRSASSPNKCQEIDADTIPRIETECQRLANGTEDTQKTMNITMI